MTQKTAILTLSVLAAATIAAERFVTASGTYPTARGGAHGVSNTSASIGSLFAVDTLGTSVATAGAAFAKDVPLAISIAGKVIAAETLDVIVAKSLQASTADGDRVEVFLIPNATPASGT